MRLFAPSSTKQVQESFSSTQSWIAPVGVTKLDSLTARGGYGSDATSGYYDPNTVTSVSCTFVNGTSTLYGPGASPGNLIWSSVQGPGNSGLSTINAGGSGTINQLDYVQYGDGYHISGQTNSFSNAIAGTASILSSGGWKTSGPVVSGDFGAQSIRYTQQGAYNPGSPATTGPSTSAFGHTFPGGFGFVQGPPQSYFNDPVVAGNSYPMSIPYGGTVTIVYTVVG